MLGSGETHSAARLWQWRRSAAAPGGRPGGVWEEGGPHILSVCVCVCVCVRACAGSEPLSAATIPRERRGRQRTRRMPPLARPRKRRAPRGRDDLARAHLVCLRHDLDDVARQAAVGGGEEAVGCAGGARAARAAWGWVGGVGGGGSRAVRAGSRAGCQGPWVEGRLCVCRASSGVPAKGKRLGGVQEGPLTDAVHVVLGVVRHVKVDHDLDVLHVCRSQITRSHGARSQIAWGRRPRWTRKLSGGGDAGRRTQGGGQGRGGGSGAGGGARAAHKGARRAAPAATPRARAGGGARQSHAGERTRRQPPAAAMQHVCVQAEARMRGAGCGGGCGEGRCLLAAGAWRWNWSPRSRRRRLLAGKGHPRPAARAPPGDIRAARRCRCGLANHASARVR